MLWLFPQNFWSGWSFFGFGFACKGVRRVRAHWGALFSARALSWGVRRVPSALWASFSRQTSPRGVRRVPSALGAPFSCQTSPQQVHKVRVCSGASICVWCWLQRPRRARARVCRVEICGEYRLGHGTFVVLPTIMWWGTVGSVLGGRFNLNSLDHV